MNSNIILKIKKNEILYKQNRDDPQLISTLFNLYLNISHNKAKRFLIETSEAYKKTSFYFSHLGLLFEQKKDYHHAAICYAKSIDASHCMIESNRDLMNLIQRLIKNKGFSSGIKLLYDVALSYELSSELKYRLFLQLNAMIFTAGDAEHSIGVEEKIALLRTILENVECNPLDESIDLEDDKKNIIILASQFLSALHSPTYLVLNIATALSEMGYNPIIINTNSFQFQDKFEPGNMIKMNSIANYEKLNKFVFDGDKVFSLPTEKPYATIIYKKIEFMFINILGDFSSKTLELPRFFSLAIKSKTPFLAVSSFDIYAELIARYTDVFLLPCNVDFPITVDCKSCVFPKNNTLEFNIKNEKYKHGLIQVAFPPECRYESVIQTYKDRLKHISEDKLTFAIVGYRLEQEVSDSFISLLKKIIISFPSSKVTFKFIGLNNIEAFETNLSKHDLLSIARVLGPQKDMSIPLSDCDFYLNPYRLGGGNSAIDALSLNVPVISYRHGDVYHACGDFFGFDNDHDIIAFIRKVITTKSYAEKVASKIETRLLEYTSLNRNNIYDAIEIMTRGMIKRDNSHSDRPTTL